MPDNRKHEIGLGDTAVIKIIKRRRRAKPETIDDLANSELAARRDKEPRGPYVLPDDPMQTGRAKIQLFDVATRFAHVDPNVRVGWALVLNSGLNSPVGGQEDFVNGFIEHDLENLGNFSSELNRIREQYLTSEPDPFGYSLTTHAGRKVANCWPLAHDSGSLFLDLYSQRKDLGVERKYILQTGQQDWIKVQTAAQRRQNFEAISSKVTDPRARVQYEKQLNILKTAEQELWLMIQTGITRDQEGVLRPRGMPGGYDLELKSPFYYEPFSTNDPANYKITASPSFFAESAPMGKIEQRDQVRVFLVPQQWRVRFSWFAWYLFVTFWAFTYVRIPNTRIFQNRFPLFPRWFSIGGAESGDPFALAPVWYWIERSKAHQAGVASDLALQFFSPFMASIFVFTSDGFFEIRRTDSFPGMLAAVVEVNGVQRYIWRTTATTRDLTIAISQGKLHTYWINSFGAEVIGGSGGVFPRIF